MNKTIFKRIVVLLVLAGMVVGIVFLAKQSQNGPISDEIAALYGLDTSKDDNDGDGLPDFVELYYTGTDPLLTDTDGNGIPDGDEDSDGDGLLNAEEIRYGTVPSKPDSDGDGLTDYEEVKQYNTKPLVTDTDGDTLSDGDEVKLGLNPLKKKSDGQLHDAFREISQELDSDNIDYMLLEDNDAVPSLQAVARGNMNRLTRIDHTASTDFSDSHAIIGYPIDITGTNAASATLTFTIRGADTDPEANKLLICQYNDDGTTKYLETTYNALYGTLSAPIDGDGTYFVLDALALLRELGIPTDPAYYAQTQAESLASNSLHVDKLLYTGHTPATKTLAGSQAASAQVDVVFLIDTTGSMGNVIDNVKNNILLFSDALREKGISASLALVDFQDITHDGMDSTTVHTSGKSNWFYDIEQYKSEISGLFLGNGGDDPETPVDALEAARQLDLRRTAQKVFVLITDATYKNDNRFGISSMADEIRLLKQSGIICSVVTAESLAGTYSSLYQETGGIWANIYGDFKDELLGLADEIEDVVVGEGYWIYLAGPVPIPVRLDEKPTEGSTVDTDHDGLYDCVELESCTPSVNLDVQDLISRLGIHGGEVPDLPKVEIYKYKSNPAEPDTDFDGISDKDDAKPKSRYFEAVLYTDDFCSGGVNARYEMNYSLLLKSVNSNTHYNSDLAEMGSIFATLAYGKKISFTSGIHTDSIKLMDVYRQFGLTDNQSYSLKDGFSVNDTARNISHSIPKYEDDDVSQVYVGHRVVSYGGVEHEVIIVSVRGTNGTIEEWSSNFDVGADDPVYDDYKNSQWTNKQNHKGFDVTANRIKVFLDWYVDTYVDNSMRKSIFIAGHSRGGALTNILGAMFEDDHRFDSYAYGFATPNTTTSSYASAYQTVFSVVNEDDIVPYLPMESWGFRKYGQIARASIAKVYEDTSLKKVPAKGTWEWLVYENSGKKIDYNCNGNLKNTVNAFSDLIPIESSPSETRKNLYKYPSKDGEQRYDNGYKTRAAAEAAVKELTENYGERLSKYATISITSDTNIWGNTKYGLLVKQTPAFAMMNLADLAAGDKGAAKNAKTDLGIAKVFGNVIGFQMAKAYEKARNEFVHTALDTALDTPLGGMTHGHCCTSYYLLGSSLDGSVLYFYLP